MHTYNFVYSYARPELTGERAVRTVQGQNTVLKLCILIPEQWVNCKEGGSPLIFAVKKRIIVIGTSWGNNWSEHLGEIATFKFSEKGMKAAQLYVESNDTFTSEESPEGSNCYYNNGLQLEIVVEEAMYNHTNQSGASLYEFPELFSKEEIIEEFKKLNIRFLETSRKFRIAKSKLGIDMTRMGKTQYEEFFQSA